MVNKEIRQFEIYIVPLDPTKGSEIKKTKPCVIISPNEMNSLNTVLIAPMTTKGINFPTRISVKFQEKKGQVALDQIRAIDKKRLSKKVGELTRSESEKVLNTLQAIFSK
jgi:mRNA interferase MazF